MARPLAAALALAGGLLSLAPLSAQAQGTWTPLLSSAVVPAGQLWTTRYQYRTFCSETVSPFPGPTAFEGQAVDPYVNTCIDESGMSVPDSGQALEYRVQFVSDTPPDLSEQERIEALFELFYLALGALAAIWAMKQFILRQVTNT